MSELTTTRSPELIVGEIVTITQQTQRIVLGNAIEVGRRFTELKASVHHGEWGKWLRAAGYSKSSANNMMRIFDQYGAEQMGLFGGEANRQTFGNLEYSKALALLAVPEEERESFAQEVDAENISVRELKSKIKELEMRAEKAEQRNKDENERHLKQLERARDDMEANGAYTEKLNTLLKKTQTEAQQAQADAELAREAAQKREQELQLLQARLTDLESRPVEVAVETVNATDEQLAKARQAAQEAAQREIDDLRKQLDMAKKQAEQSTNSSADKIAGELNADFKTMQAVIGGIKQKLPQMDEVNEKRYRAALTKALRQFAEELA